MATRATRRSSRLAPNTTPTNQSPRTQESINPPVSSPKHTSKRSEPIPSNNNINNKINGALGVGPCEGADDEYGIVGTVEIEHTEQVTVEKETVEISNRGTKRKVTVSKSEQYSSEEDQDQGVEVKVRTEKRTKKTKVKDATIEMKPLAPRTANLRMFVGAHISAAKVLYGNLVGSSLRCLLPAALVLDARARVLGPDRPYETDLAEVMAKRHLLLGLRWHTPLVSGYRKQPAEAGGPPPLVVATAVHADGGGRHRLRVAVREGYDVLSESTACDAGADEALDTLERTDIGALPAGTRDVVREQVADILATLAGR